MATNINFLEYIVDLFYKVFRICVNLYCRKTLVYNDTFLSVSVCQGLFCGVALKLELT